MTAPHTPAGRRIHPGTRLYPCGCAPGVQRCETGEQLWADAETIYRGDHTPKEYSLAVHRWLKHLEAQTPYSVEKSLERLLAPSPVSPPPIPKSEPHSQHSAIQLRLF